VLAVGLNVLSIFAIEETPVPNIAAEFFDRTTLCPRFITLSSRRSRKSQVSCLSSDLSCTMNSSVKQYTLVTIALLVYQEKSTALSPA